MNLSGNTIYNNIDELLEDWGYSSIFDLVYEYEVNNFIEFAIYYGYINPQGYTGDYNNQIAKDFSITCPNENIYDLDTNIPYYEYQVYISGTYNFTLQAERKQVSVSIDINITEEINIFETDGNGTILGLKDEFLSSDNSCMAVSLIDRIEIPNKIGNEEITSIGENAFTWTIGIKYVFMTDSINNIGQSAFCFCKDLENIKLSENIETIEYETFCSCPSLKNITIPENVTSIGQDAFFDCSSLTSITIPENITSIGYAAFNYCSSLKNVNYTGTEYEWNSIEIESNNTNLINATINYNYSEE